jgi:predicted enzyme related to lactoylglutathione lyase
VKRILLTSGALIVSFGLGFAFNHFVAHTTMPAIPLKRVTGIGGIFFKCKDPGKIRDWYKTHLGLATNPYGCVFEWHQGADSTQKGFTQWSPFKDSTKYFAPSTRDFMVNYRVANLSALVTQLQVEGVTILDTIATYDYGKFVHILDVEGNKIELWEPNDIAYEKMGREMGAETTK